MQYGTKSTCQSCGEPIQWQGRYWEHTTCNPRHIGIPPRYVELPEPLNLLPRKPSKADQILVDLGPWASAGMDDPRVCKELKRIFSRVINYVAEEGLV